MGSSFQLMLQVLIGLFCCLFGADPTPNFRDLLAVAYLSHRADLSVRLDICRKVSDCLKKQLKPALAGWMVLSGLPALDIAGFRGVLTTSLSGLVGLSWSAWKISCPTC